MIATEDGEFKIVFTGPMGAGKTTAVAAISEMTPIHTEVENTDLASHAKAATTVGFDFGRISLADGHVVRLYGTPGQARFRFMWDILGRGAAGAIILIDATHPDALAQMDQFVDAFLPLVPSGAIVLGIGRTDAAGAPDSEAFAARLEDRGVFAPVFTVDVRERDDVLLLVRTLVGILHSRLQA